MSSQKKSVTSIVTSRLRGAVLCLLCLVGSPVTGRTIQWFCDPGGSKLFSGGAALDGAIQFELGVFADGFVPSVENRSEWTSHWVPAQRVDYVASTAVFNGTVTVDANDVPFTVGAKAYIWGFTGDLEDGEWILARQSTWTWPAPDPFVPFQLEWNIGAATEVLAGTVIASGSPFLLQTAAVGDLVPPTTSWPQWQEDELAGEPDNGPSDDPDRDGLSNLEEYAAGTPPLQAAEWVTVRPAMVTLAEAGRYPVITVPLRADRELALEIGVSGDLEQWDFDPSATVVASSTAGTVTYRGVVSLDLAPRQFLRARLTLLP